MKKTIILALSLGLFTACSVTDEQLETNTEVKAIHVDVERYHYDEYGTITKN